MFFLIDRGNIFAFYWLSKAFKTHQNKNKRKLGRPLKKINIKRFTAQLVES
jgi:hypothetical protein